MAGSSRGRGSRDALGGRDGVRDRSAYGRRAGAGTPYTRYETTRLRHHRRRVLMSTAVLTLVVVCVVGGAAWGLTRPRDSTAGTRPPTGTSLVGGGGTGLTVTTGSASGTTAARTVTTAASADPMVALAAAPINTAFPGLTMFRGNGHRSYYGEGPLPKAPKALWRFPQEGGMGSQSAEFGKTTYWGGTGWTCQPVVIERGGKVQVMFGAYDRAVHVLDGDTGTRVLPDLMTGDLVKGSASVDPDGYPLFYTGSRDNFLRVIALDRDQPTVLWKYNADNAPHPVWNNDWDSDPLIVGDYLFEGCENSYFYIIKLNRGYGADGKVTVKPKVVLEYPAYDDALFAAIGDRNVSIENSPAIHLDPVRGDRVYFSNSGGRVLGLDIGVLGLSKAGYGPAGQAPATPGGLPSFAAAAQGATAEAGQELSVAGAAAAAALPALPAKPGFPVVFKFWTGDDTDATIVIDDEGKLYVASELERNLKRALEVGQLMKLDPYNPDDPLVWSIKDPVKGDKGGIWATPAIYGGMLYVPTHTGRLLGVDRMSGAIVWEKTFTWHAWSSPLVVDDTLVVGDTDGWIHAYDLTDPAVDPPELWKVRTPGGGAVESTPAVWKGRIYVGSRDGFFYAFGDG